MKYISKILKFIFSRLFIIGALIAIQLGILAALVWNLSSYFVYVYAFFTILGFCLMFFVISRDDNPSVKLAWVIAIMGLPVFGGLLYVLFGRTRLPKKYKQKMIATKNITDEYYPENSEIMAELFCEDKLAGRQCKYLQNVTNMPLYKGTTAEYLKIGEVMFESLLTELKSAKRFIFMEYFIIHEGKMWDTILDILVDKAAAGLDVRVMYDDVGCLQTLPTFYSQRLVERGINCVVFNPFRPSLSPSLQNRDHRKITVIDGNVGFTGGINLADEYINEFEKHGHWKDCAVMIKGDAVFSLTLLFLEAWNFYQPTDKNFDLFSPCAPLDSIFASDGYVMPYGDTPLDEEYVSESIYLNIINNATEYLYINSPYFIVDNEVVTAMKLAAKRGVEVIMVTPHIADKWYVHIMTRSFYPFLIHAGVKIYEYTPGFIHSKTFVCDDNIATIGTVNLDYRSLYHHYECGVWLYKNSAVMQLKEDFLDTLKLCKLISYEESIDISIQTKLARSFLRLFAPLM